MAPERGCWKWGWRRAGEEDKRRDISRADRTGFDVVMCWVKSSPGWSRETHLISPACLPECLSHRHQHTCNARVSWEGSVENVKASLAHRRGDQAVLEGRHHTAGAARRHGSLRVRVMWGAECLQLPIKSWNASMALSYCRAQVQKIISTWLDPHSAWLHMTKCL